jgi:5-methylthioadenosine/S-adenosylhomocysteine deaminase
MRCALTIHRLASGNPSAIGPDEIFRMATIEGARCYDLEKDLGSLEKRKLADIVILDGSRVPTPLTPSSVVGHLINTFSGRDVRDVVVNGQVVVKDRLLTKTSDDHVSEISKESAKGLWNRLSPK